MITSWIIIKDGISSGLGTAESISYDNTFSGLTATNLKDAVDELNLKTSSAWTKTKKISFTGFVAKETSINVNSDGVNYTVSGDILNLGIDAEAFNNNKLIYITYNGVDQEKGVDIIYLTDTTFKIIDDVDENDDIIIMF